MLVFGAFVNILGVVSNYGLGNCGTDSIDLSCDTSTLYADTDVQVGELVLTQDKNRFEGLKTKRFRLNVLNWLTIHLN